MNRRLVVLVSGGMDSCVTAAIAAAQGQPAFLHVSYGQRTESKERACFEAIADHFAVDLRLAARLDYLREIGGSSLTDTAIPVPPSDLLRAGVPPTYVPFRNAQLLSAAVAWAEVIGAVSVYIGAVEEDSSGYPDCRREFYDLFERVIEAGTRPETRITIQTPVIHLRKSAIVARGRELGAPFHLTWSCYRSEDLACGQCDSCALRLRAFTEAGVEDPLPYRARPA
ncbi:MAG TPA: 7-cyano-7-deazaguanine synthase [Patescibacteria group bacterium]|nr:7-cyano-7-deazaguanine synthase [Patescibacteria group bacterium]